MRITLTGSGAGAAELAAALRARGVEVTEQPELKKLSEEPVILCTAAPLPEFIEDEAAALAAIKSLDAGEKIVMLLDAGRDAGGYIPKRVFERAAMAAAMQRPVYVLARSMRGAEAGAEAAFAAAREAGAIFIRYESVAVQAEPDRSHTVTVSDGDGEYILKTKLLIDCAAERAAVDVRRVRPRSGFRWFEALGVSGSRRVCVYDEAMLALGAERAAEIFAAAVAAAQPEGTAVVDSAKCAFCYTCYRVCPHGAPLPDEAAGAMRIDTKLCAGCGICGAICPAGAISRSDAKAAPEKRNGLLALCCENSAAAVAGEAFAGLGVDVRELFCGGELKAETVAAALRGYEGVLIAVCPINACRHYEGNLRAAEVTERLTEELAALGVDTSRVELVRASAGMPKVLRDAAERLKGRLRA